MDQEKWRKLMDTARERAIILNRRTAVVAVEVGARSAAHFGTRWAYVVTTSDRLRARRG